jgi:2-polyprenyl-3-methyl-5-hydroxy-6-metoxy-1,4-benzoquinol methylase
MSVVLDPKQREIITLRRSLGDLTGKRILEIGCGDGRLTWLYANKAAQVVGIDPKLEEITLARQNTPPQFAHTVEFYAANLEEYVAQIESGKHKNQFHIALLSWAL